MTVQSHPATTLTGSWRDRLGLRAMLIAAALLLLIAGGVVTNVVLSRQSSPEGASQRYLDGLRSGDASAAWSAMEVNQPQQPVEAKLLDESSLKAALSGAKPNYQSATVTKTAQDGASAATDIRVSRPEGELQTTLLLRRDDAERRYGIYPSWRVVVPPAVLRATLPEGASGVVIDGQPVHVSGAGEHTKSPCFRSPTKSNCRAVPYWRARRPAWMRPTRREARSRWRSCPASAT